MNFVHDDIRSGPWRSKKQVKFISSTNVVPVHPPSPPIPLSSAVAVTPSCGRLGSLTADQISQSPPWGMGREGGREGGGEGGRRGRRGRKGMEGERKGKMDGGKEGGKTRKEKDVSITCILESHKHTYIRMVFLT